MNGLIEQRIRINDNGSYYQDVSFSIAFNNTEYFAYYSANNATEGTVRVAEQWNQRTTQKLQLYHSDSSFWSILVIGY